ncbi:Protein CBG18211 [Caenorhabditis briggsae]|uniref:PCI domain-containing protein 2 homolog n=2 Tax=Caenorhabditis briggsae TaxID=6238 RepID=PCID2_CAEBR|nr:Protein CBG18211 [Caenorhabditis briggsae]Q60YJ7.1 RecName: Full=PCI domain-containing protein 2 homolog; AltName: Full=CSN12-like protein [Caenorhabditis briggsae]ULU00944.1 hypothetical protein L3Y34_001389 [Caenorhabditis briggsae]UMM23609.1 hypothetical protein L5515_004245 [Caenorhabditis briggsae]CAP35701.1 Protein CBG18211 [Caenorhabditis briggsae]
MSFVRNISDYFNKIDNLCYNQSWESGDKIAKYLSLNDDHSKEAYLHISEYGSTSRRCRVSEDEIIDEIVCLHLHVLHSVHVAKDLISSQSTQIRIIQLFNKEILQKRKDENWFLPIFYRLCTDLRWLSKGAESCASGDDEGDSNANSFFESAAKAITECYRTCVSDVHAEEGKTKKVAMLNMTNQLFQIYFQINKLNLLKPLIRAIDNCGPLYNKFLMADKVAYNYFLGRKALFDGDLILAEKGLVYAFRNCPTESVSNKRKILVYLIPVKMFLGHMPTASLLHRYRLDEFQEVVAAVKDGHLGRVDNALLTNGEFFIKCGIYLVLEKLRTITYRNLFKKVSQMVGKVQIPLDAFQAALRFVGVTDVDMDELECIIANLIAEKKVKGYLAHQHQKLVISKTNAFPTLSSVSSN